MAVRDLTARNAIEGQLWVRISIFINIYFLFIFFSIEFFEGVIRGGPYKCSMDRSVSGGPWTQSVGLVHGPGVSVFGSPLFAHTSKGKVYGGTI